MSNKCTGCGSSAFDIHIEPDDFMRNDQSFTVNLEHSVCQECGNTVIFSEQIKRNDCVLRDAWRKIDGLLTAREIVVLRNKLQLTQQDASKVFGGGVNAFSKYERSEVIQSVAMDKLLRSALVVPGMLAWLKQQAGLNEILPASNYDNVVPFKPQTTTDLHPISQKPLFSESDNYPEIADYG